MKKTLFNVKNLFIVLSIIIISLSAVFCIEYKNGKKVQEAQAIEWVDSLMDTSIGKGVSKIAPTFTVVNGAISLVGSIYKGVNATISADDGEGVEAFFKALIGAETAGQKAILNELGDIKESINQVSGKVDAINNKLTTLNSKLDGITNQLNGMLTVINSSVEDIKVSLYKSQLEMQDWTTIYTQISNFYTKYADVRTTLTTHIDTINKRNADFEQFLQNAYSLENGEEIRAVVEKITLNYQDSYDALSQSEKDLLETTVGLNNSSYKIGKYISDYNEYLYKYLKDDVYTRFASGYSSNMYLTFQNMADYILGNKNELGSGIGEVFYKLAVMGYATNTEAHIAYKKFVSNVLTDFILTGYVCDMSLKMQAKYLTANNGNNSEIQTCKDYIENIKAITLKCIAYLDYEYKKCVNDYDLDGFTPSFGYTINDYIVFYGNPVNLISQNKYVLKRDYAPNELYVNESYIYLASGESFETKIYYDKQEIQSYFDYVSSDENVAKVSSTGIITGITSGDCIISLKLKSTGKTYPIISVSVSNAYVEKNGTINNVYEFGKGLQNQFSCNGDGLTYHYGSTIMSTSIVFDTDKSKLHSISQSLDAYDNFLTEFSIFCNNENVIIDDDTIRTHITTSGAITLVHNNKDFIIQIPIIGDTNHYRVGDANVSKEKTDEESNTVYVYTKEQLLALRESSTKKSDNFISFDYNIKLMADIDFEWDVWETCWQIKGVFDGNGHVIKNITIQGIFELTETVSRTVFEIALIAGVSDDEIIKNYLDGSEPSMYSYTLTEYYGLCKDLTGEIKNLTLENIAYKPADLNRLVDDQHWFTRIKDKSEMTLSSCEYRVLCGKIIDCYTNIENCVLTGTSTISETRSFNYYAYTYRISCSANYIAYGKIKNCINDLDLTIDCNNKDFKLNVSGFYSTTFSWYNGGEYTETPFYNLYSGNIKVINIVDNSKVNIARFSLSSDYNAENCLYYEGTVCSSTNTANETKYFTTDNYGSKVTWNESTSNEFWTSKEFKNFDTTNVVAPYTLPKPKQAHIKANFSKFKATYIVGEQLDIANLQILDENNNDITSLVSFSNFDNSTVGEKTITASYKTETLTFKVQYTDYEKGCGISYLSGKNGTGENIDKYGFVQNSKIVLSGELFTKDGYAQTGWSTTDGGEKIYELCQKIELTENLSLYPVFNKVYKLMFNLDGGEVNETFILPEDYVSTKTLTLPSEQEIHKSGYVFLGWTLTNDADDVEYIKEVNATEIGDKTFYAKYQKVAEPSTDDGTSTGDDSSAETGDSTGDDSSASDSDVKNPTSTQNIVIMVLVIVGLLGVTILIIALLKKRKNNKTNRLITNNDKTISNKTKKSSSKEIKNNDKKIKDSNKITKDDTNSIKTKIDDKSKAPKNLDADSKNDIKQTKNKTNLINSDIKSSTKANIEKNKDTTKSITAQAKDDKKIKDAKIKDTKTTKDTKSITNTNKIKDTTPVAKTDKTSKDAKSINTSKTTKTSKKIKVDKKSNDTKSIKTNNKSKDTIKATTKGTKTTKIDNNSITKSKTRDTIKSKK